MRPVSIRTEEQGWVGGCGVTPARRVNPKTKPFEIPTLHHCQHCPLPAGAWHGPSTPPARPLPTPAVSSWGGDRRALCRRGQLCFRPQLPRVGRGPTVSPNEGRGGRGWRGRECTGQRIAGGTWSIRYPSVTVPLRWHWGGQRAAPCCPWSEASGCAASPCPLGLRQPSTGFLPQFPLAAGGVSLPTDRCLGARALLALMPEGVVQTGEKRDHSEAEPAVPPRKVGIWPLQGLNAAPRVAVPYRWSGAWPWFPAPSRT